MKKAFGFILIGVLCTSTVVFAVSKLFPDVPTNAWYATAVNNLVNKGIIKGYPDGTFKPTNNVNRAEIAVMLDNVIKYVDATKASSLTFDEAKEIAENSTCKDEGNLTNEYHYNEITKTWWFNTDIKKSGCSPACVVKDDTKTAEINWMCTGLLIPTFDKTVKSCQVASDCKAVVNVKYGGECAAGCFNNKAIIDPVCEETIDWEPMLDSCVCKNNECIEETNAQ